jgi:transcription initiation factor TFIIIB Brf1 subunit/transcription initiation factor TFIIB
VEGVAFSLFKTVKEKVLRGRKPAAVQAACIYVACRQEGTECTFRQVCGAAPGSTVRDIGRAFAKINETLQEQSYSGVLLPTYDGAVVEKIASKLSLAPDLAKASHELTQRCCVVLRAELPQSADLSVLAEPAIVAAVAIRLALQLRDDKRLGPEHISHASGMKAEEIEQAVLLVFPRVRELAAGLASDFRREDAIRRIEACYSIDINTSIMESKVENICSNLGVDIPVVSAAKKLLTALQLPAGAIYRATQRAGASPTAVAASLVWLAMLLRGGSTARVCTSMLVAASGVTVADLRKAASAIFPEAPELAAGLYSTMREPAALAQIDASLPRMLWLGDAAQLAPAVAYAAAADATVPDAAPPHIPSTAAAAAMANATPSPMTAQCCRAPKPEAAPATSNANANPAKMTGMVSKT